MSESHPLRLRGTAPSRRHPAGPGAVLVLFALIPAATAAPPAHQVTIDGMRFQPESLAIRQGERVTWVNKDLVSHTATHGDFDSRNIRPGASWTFTPRKPGTYNYVCAFHPGMKGVLVVRGKGGQQ